MDVTCAPHRPDKLQFTRRLFLGLCTAEALSASASAPDSISLLKLPQTGLQPQAVVDRSGIIHAVYLYGDPAAADIGYVRKLPDEQGFSTPIRVNSRPGSAIAVGTVRGVHVALGRSGRVHAVWNGSSKAEPKAPRNSTPMLYTRLDNQGKGFEPERNLIRTATGLDGGGAVAADQVGNVYVSWHAQGQKDGQPIEGEDHRRVWIARSTDDGRTFDPERAVSPPETGVCGCCGMGAIADDSGNLYLLYRSARALVHRDMYLLVSRDNGSTLAATNLHPWEIGACPMSTVSLAQTSQRILLSWETNKQVYFAEVDRRTSAIGSPKPAPGPPMNRKHPAITASSDGQMLLCWTEGTGWKKGGSLKYRLFGSDARPLTSGDEGPVIPSWGLATAASVRRNFVVIC